MCNLGGFNLKEPPSGRTSAIDRLPRSPAPLQLTYGCQDPVPDQGAFEVARVEKPIGPLGSPQGASSPCWSSSSLAARKMSGSEVTATQHHSLV